MQSFEEAGLDLSDILRAIVLGGNVLGERKGAKKRRRRVPYKQANVVRLVAEHGIAELEEFQEVFSSEWDRIAKRYENKATVLAERKFFRNIADLAARVNDALLAGYEDKTESMLDLTGDTFIGLVFDYQDFTVSWHDASNLDELLEALPRTEGKAHVPLTEAEEPPEPTTPGEPKEPTPSDEPAEPTEPLELTVHEDPITGAWRFEFDGHDVEVQPRHGYVKIDGNLHPCEVVKDLEEPEDLRGEPLDEIATIIEQFSS